MAKKDIEDQVHKQIEREVQSIKWKMSIMICRTALISLFGIASVVGSWVMNHSDRAFGSIYYLVYGDKPK